MLLSFTLSMPSNNSWDGKWSGEDRNYIKVVVVNSKNAALILDKGYFHYNFGDGWAAGIEIEEVTAAEAFKLKKKSDGFCGYDWMINSIISHGKIQT